MQKEASPPTEKHSGYIFLQKQQESSSSTIANLRSLLTGTDKSVFILYIELCSQRPESPDAVSERVIISKRRDRKVPRVVASMGQRGNCPILVLPSLNRFCPDHGRSLHLAMRQQPIKNIIMPVSLTSHIMRIKQLVQQQIYFYFIIYLLVSIGLGVGKLRDTCPFKP